MHPSEEKQEDGLSVAPAAQEAPQVRETPEPFVSGCARALSGRTQALEDLAVELYARGLSTRDIEDAFTDERGRRHLSRAAVTKRDLSEHAIAYLYVDGIAERLRPGQKREAALAAWAIGADGRKVLVASMAGSKEDVETVRAFFQDLRARGPGDPLLVVSDGAPGIIRAIEECFPRSARQRCPAHRMRNRAVKVSADLWPEFKACVAACHQALSRAIARDLASGIRADYAVVAPSALACFDDDFEACVAHLRLPVTHRRGAPTTNLLERVILACVTCSTRSSGVLARSVGLSFRSSLRSAASSGSGVPAHLYKQNYQMWNKRSLPASGAGSPSPSSNKFRVSRHFRFVENGHPYRVTVKSDGSLMFDKLRLYDQLRLYSGVDELADAAPAERGDSPFV